MTKYNVSLGGAKICGEYAIHEKVKINVEIIRRESKTLWVFGLNISIGIDSNNKISKPENILIPENSSVDEYKNTFSKLKLLRIEMGFPTSIILKCGLNGENNINPTPTIRQSPTIFPFNPLNKNLCMNIVPVMKIAGKTCDHKDKPKHPKTKLYSYFVLAL